MHVRRLLRSALVSLLFFACSRGQAPVARPVRPIAPTAVEPAPPQIAEAPAPQPAPPPAPPAIRIALEHEEAIDRAVEAALARRAMPGCVVLVGRSDGTIFRRAYGARAVDPTVEPMTEDTIFDLASVTKPTATALLAMWLAERGTIDLDAPASRYLAQLDPRITIRHLLTHTAGLAPVDPLSDYDAGRDAALEHIVAMRLGRAPGTRMVYSDLGFILLGVVLERASGRPIDALLQEAIYAPLGMHDTRFSPPRELLGRIAPTERAERRGGALIRGDVHDPRAFRLGGVAGNAGLFSTADDLSRLARMLLHEGELDGARVLSAESVRTMVASEGRALGWERGHPSLSARAYGHGGWTGTALWIDPENDVFFVFLSNRVHPDGHGDVRGLVNLLAGLARDAAVSAVPLPSVEVLSGIDVLRRDRYSVLEGARVALLTNDAARARDGARTLDLLAAAPNVTLVRVLAPEHGLTASREGRIGADQDASTGLEVHSLFGASRDPTPEMLEGVDTIVIDLQDVGVRFYTYGATVGRVLRAARERDLRVVVLDRPEPSGGGAPEGPVCEPELFSFVNHHALPAYHGMTIGELATMLDDEIGARLTIVPLEGWRRGMRFADTGLRWVPPSPNLRTPDEALLYPALALIEGTNVSVGRGTATPFEVIGAPWLDAGALIAEIGELPGVRLSPTRFSPRSAALRGVSCRGVRFELVDRDAFDAVRTGLAIARALRRVHPRQWDADAMLPMLGDRAVHRALLDGADVDALIQACEPRLSEFTERRTAHLRYP